MSDDLDFGNTVKGFAPGQKVFGRYTLGKILGRGGMGVVWLARDEDLERDIALKFLPEIVAADPQSIKDLKRETRRSLDLTHPNIIRIYDFVQGDNTAAISMEFVEGSTLAARKVDQPGGHFETHEIQPWVRELGEALEYAHTRAEVVHRDLKPANLMIDGRGELKIADFGIAASVSDSVSRVSVQAGSSGTPVYMSPQQMMGEMPSVADDVYAFGATLYELLTSRPPFFSGNVMMQVMNKVPPSMAQRREELEVSGKPIPEAWERTVAECLAKEPGDRPASIAAAVAALGGRGTTAQAATAPETTPEQRQQFQDAFNDMFGKQFPEAASQRGSDLQKNIRMTAEDMRIGGTFDVPLTLQGVSKTLQIKIPPGVQVGTRIRLSGMGEPGRNGGEAGDLYLRLTEPVPGPESTPPPIPPQSETGQDPGTRSQPEPADRGRGESAKAKGPDAKKKPKDDEAEFTLVGKILFLVFLASAVAFGANKLGWLDQFDRPAPDTVLVERGLEHNISEAISDTSVNGFYRVKRALGTLRIDGTSAEVPVEVRDRSFYNWGDVITVQTNRWTGRTTAAAQEITVRVAATIPDDIRYIKRTGELSLDVLMEIPVVQTAEGKPSEFDNFDLRWEHTVPVKIVPEVSRDFTDRWGQITKSLVGFCFLFGLARLLAGSIFGNAIVSGVLGWAVAAGLGYAAVTGYLDAEDRFERNRDAQRVLAEAEEQLARGDLEAAEAFVDEALMLNPGMHEANRLKTRIAETPVTLLVPGDYATVAEALSQTKSGDTIEIAPGVYEGGLVITKDISIRGTGEQPGDTILRVSNPQSGDNGDNNVIKVESGRIVRVSNVALEHVGSLGTERRPPVVLVRHQGTRLTLENVIVQRSVSHGVAALNGGQVDIIDSSVRDNAWSGIYVRGADSDGTASKIAVRGVAEFSYLNENADFGVRAIDGGIVELSGTYVSNNGDGGIKANEGGVVDADNIGLFDNEGYAVTVEDPESKVTLRNSHGAGNSGGNINRVNNGQVDAQQMNWN